MTELEREIEEVNAVVLTPEQEASIDAAIANAREPEPHEVAVWVRFDPECRLLLIELGDGRRLSFPQEDLQGVAEVSVEAAMKVHLESLRRAIWWDDLDLGFTVEGLKEGRTGNAKWMRRLEEQRQNDLVVPSRTA